MNTFDECFSECQIIRCLINERDKLRNSRHKKHYYHLVSNKRPPGEQARPDLAKELEGLFPPRRQWARYRLRRKDRKGRSPGDMDRLALQKAVFRLMRENPGLPWARRLRERALMIRSRALHETAPTFAPPTVVADLKKPQSHEYRPLAIYSMDDNIIQKIAARYFNRKFDLLFSDSSLAYRCVRKEPELSYNRDTALRRIIKFRDRHPKVFVAEADLRSFMDCICHRMARNSLSDLIAQAKSLQPEFEIDPRALRIFDASLGSYSYRQEVLDQAQVALRKRDPVGCFPWPEDLLRRLHEREDFDEIGIPQGGPLSCFITNLVLHDVDQAVGNLEVPDGHDLLYLRYCDDMLILTTDMDLCRKAMGAYQAAVGSKRLPLHQPVDVIQHNHGPAGNAIYWDAKSKNPYPWSQSKDGGIPWIQFLGFEFRHDGHARIRRKSLDKQCHKMTEEANRLLRTIKPRRKTKDGIPAFSPGLRMSPARILERFRMKLIAMSVGRRKLGQKMPSCAEEISSKCWAFGFKCLWDAPFYNASQLKQLDRHRDRQWKRVRNVLKPLMKRKDSEPHVDGSGKRHPYHGFPFSYYGQFARVVRRTRISGKSAPETNPDNGGDVG